ncbi:lipopolysaccharide transport periplasmic protein LptA [Celerinatantimonas diazotrophica]|uniref:Lipopolysaccharide export system protein LptA n=1 Tax=Celerinatantimonas diazotrophica TaxID=412034 RepID=A0A4R1KF36_9GAMM|nr:lipopolysaccharide transport periplasmic protein LptA [Celerinatantimonas diazotrophica]TCK63224.1 lipopolysaccharide export system protein LptA [Celerinatantimonas diazotrophica]CAG9295593.1 Lipopolysaccharide export system protein LptA [Celerinatantimonas diazotrophica]
MNKINSIAFFVLLTLSASAQALESDYSQKIVVNADQQKVDIKKNTVTFFNHVTVTQGSIKLNADKVTVYGTGEKGSEVMIADGHPAKFQQKMDDGRLMKGHANHLRYELKSRIVTLTGDAQLQQQESLVKGDTIRYNIKSQEMVADGGKQGHVTTIFEPQQLQQNKNKQK